MFYGIVFLERFYNSFQLEGNKKWKYIRTNPKIKPLSQIIFLSDFHLYSKALNIFYVKTLRCIDLIVEKDFVVRF